MPPQPDIGDDVLFRLAQLSRSPVVVAEASGRILAVNDAAAALFDRTREELVGLGLAQLRDDEGEAPALVGGVGETRLVRKGGARVPASWTSTYIPRGDEGRVWLALADLSAVRSVEAALRVREDELVALSDATIEALFVHQDGVILATNEAARALYRLEADGAVGRQLVEFIAPEALPEVQRRIAARSGEPYESIGLRSDGTKFVASVQARTTTFRGRPARLAAIRDLTDVKRMQANLAFADRMASVGALAAGVAHEINNPLSFVMLGLEHVIARLGARATTSPDDTALLLETLGDVQLGVRRVQAIVRDLKTFSRPVEEPTRPVALQPVLEYAVRMAMVEIKHRASLRLEVGELPPVLGNETRLGQVFLNLLVNAAHAIPQGAADRNEIRVRATREGGDVVVVVEDTGEGIEPELLDRIFEPFTSTKSHGAGLGLAISHGIVTQLGGRIEASSARGEGTTFRVRLPVAASETKAVLEAAPAPAGAPHARHRVLLIDDETPLRTITARLLAPDYDVTALASAKDALALFAGGGRFDVVLCDMLMPEMTGMAFYRELALRHPDLAERVVFLTGGVFTQEATTFFETSSRPRLEKPFAAEALIEAIESVAAGRA